MAGCSGADIQIGGKVPKWLMPKLIQLLLEADLIHLYEVELTPNSFGLLELGHNEAPGGWFQELEAFLQKHGIDYDRQTYPSYGYDPGNVSWRGGKCWSSSREATDDLRKRLKRSLPALLRDKEALRRFVKRNGPPPKLKPFTITGK